MSRPTEKAGAGRCLERRFGRSEFFAEAGDYFVVNTRGEMMQTHSHGLALRVTYAVNGGLRLADA